MKAVGPVLAVLILIGLIISGTLYTVDQRQNAILFQLGEIKDVVEKPGLHFKWPLLQNVRHFDMRILTYDDAEPLRFLTQGNRPVLVDSFVKWHIIDAQQYYVSVRGDKDGPLDEGIDQHRPVALRQEAQGFRVVVGE